MRIKKIVVSVCLVVSLLVNSSLCYGEQITTLNMDSTGYDVILKLSADKDLSPKRKAVMLKGLEILRFTQYNMGDKQNDLESKRPLYLDCSGYIQWALLRSVGFNIGHGTAVQYEKSIKISEDELKVGDLGFRKPGGVQNLGGGNHVGFFVGYDDEGNKLWMHCGSGKQNGVFITKYDNFIYYARPRCFEEEK